MNLPPSRRRLAFTLVELLVTMALLVLMVVSVAQVVSSTASLTGAVRQTMDAGAEGILVLNRMEADFRGLVLRSDVDYYFRKDVGNDEFAFFTQANGFYPQGVSGTTAQSPLALAGYRIGLTGGAMRIERLNKALVWNGVVPTTTGASGSRDEELLPIVFRPNTIAGKWPNITNGGSDPDYQAVGSQVFRLEVCFLMNDGTVSSDPPANLATEGLADVRALVVAIAVLDAKSRVLVPDLTKAAEELIYPDPDDPTALPAAVWKSRIDGGKMPMPNVAASQIRVYQRPFLLPHAK